MDDKANALLAQMVGLQRHQLHTLTAMAAGLAEQLRMGRAAATSTFAAGDDAAVSALVDGLLSAAAHNREFLDQASPAPAD